MQIEGKLDQIDKLKARIDQLGIKGDWDQAFLERLKIDFTHVSNQIEGNTITYGQTVKMLRDLVMPAQASAGEILDIVSHKKVLDVVFRTYRDEKMSEERIKPNSMGT
jgi:Fic family protein